MQPAISRQYSGIAFPAAAAGWTGRPVAIYHTHTDESYLPSDGKVSIPFRGGIIEVGRNYKNSLTREGAKAVHDGTPHDPHDNNAYYRSRRTAFELLKQKPAALFDVHRDGIDDPEFYREYIANESVAQIRLVVGRQNPHMAANLDFARRLMAFANKTNGPVVKEIFISHGNYNQDLLSTALLIEAGTYSNRKEEAINGIERLAGAVPVVLGITSPPGAYHPAGGSGVWVAVVMITSLVLLCAGLFIIINAGGLNEAKKLLVDFYRRDLAGILEPLGNRISANMLEPLKNKIPVHFKQRVKIAIDRIKKYLSTTGS